MMDILKIYKINRHDRPRRHALEQILFNQVRDVMRMWKEQIEDSLFYLGEPPWPDNSQHAFLDTCFEEQDDIFGIMAALLGDDNSFENDCIDCDAIERIIAGRKKRRSVEDAAPIRASAPPPSPKLFVPRVMTRNSRYGRPTEDKWAELVAATVERCFNGPIPLLEDLVRDMLEWWTEHWGETPASSEVRGYVAPIFHKFEAHWQKTSVLFHSMTKDEYLAIRREEAKRIDPATAEVTMARGQILDPYGFGDLPDELLCMGKNYFARRPGSKVWVSYDDLPEDVCAALWARV